NKAAEFGSTTFTAWDPQNSPMTLTASSSVPSLIPDGNITIRQTGSSGGTNSYQLTLVPAGVQTGTAQITVVATDDVGQVGRQTFFVQINPGLVALNQDGTITIPEGIPVADKATPYPSIARVSGMNGYVTGVEVSLLGFNHGYPQDVDILLVAPNNKGTILMAHAGGDNPVANGRLHFQDDGYKVPFGAALTNNGTYAPVSYASGLNFGVAGL